MLTSFNPHNPQWSTTGMAAIKYLATKNNNNKKKHNNKKPIGDNVGKNNTIRNRS